MDAEGAVELARRSRGTPRVANRLLRRVRDYAEVKADGRITAEVARRRPRPAQRRRVRAGRYGCPDPHHDHREVRRRAGGLGTVAIAVGEDAGTLQDVYEPYLIQQGFLERTQRGRCATALAYRRFGFTPPAAQATIFDA